MRASTEHADAIKQNISTFAGLLTRLGAPSLSLTYAGYGDSGQVEECGINWPEGMTGDVPESVTLVTVQTGFDGGSPRYTTQAHDLSFEDACDSFLELVLDQHGHGGWENGSGARGEMTLTAEGGLTINHFDVVEIEEEDSIVYDAPPAPAPVERPSPTIEQSTTPFQVAF